MFKNKTVLITGAAVGIGKACALQFARGNARVVMLDYNPETLADAEKEVKQITNDIISLVCDVSDNNSVINAVEKAINHFGRIDILVNNAALWRDRSSFAEVDVALWQKYFDVNVMGTIYVTKAVIGRMIESDYGRIINVASVAGVYGNANMSHYSATKGAIISFTKALAKEVAEHNITVNSVSPGSVSPAAEGDMDFVKPSIMSYAGRTGSGRENADLICFLASDSAAYINGENIIIDGCRKTL